MGNAGLSCSEQELVLDLTPCGECENDVCAALLRKELTRLVEFLDPQLFESRVTLAYEQDEAPYHVQELSRREMFSHMTEGSAPHQASCCRVLPGLPQRGGTCRRLPPHAPPADKAAQGCFRDAAALRLVSAELHPEVLRLRQVRKACRSGALKLEDMPDGQTRVVITPWKCSECGVCVAACSNSGIDGMKLRQLTTLGPVSVYKCSKTLCADCGKPIAPNSSEGICSVCRIKRRTKQRQEEAAARAKERIAEREARKAAEEAAKAAAAELAAENAANASGAAAAETAAAPVSAAPAAAAATAVSVAETASAPEKD